MIVNSMMVKKTILFLVAAGGVLAQQPRRVDDNSLKSAGKAGEEWLTYGLTQGETRYSPLNQINTTNVSGLAPGVDVRFGSRRRSAGSHPAGRERRRSTASPIGAWCSQWTLAPARSAGAGIRR